MYKDRIDPLIGRWIKHSQEKQRPGAYDEFSFPFLFHSRIQNNMLASEKCSIAAAAAAAALCQHVGALALLHKRQIPPDYPN